MSIAPGARLGAYEVLSLLGAGGMGEVYLAEDTRLRRKVALKSLSGVWSQKPGALRWLTHEARAAATLNHPNIAAIYDVLETDDRACIVMEYVDGETLAARLRRGPLAVADVIPICLQLADALTEAHAHGVIHRDLKPANIRLTASGKVKVLDFGIAKASPVTADAGTVGFDTIGDDIRAWGTPAYAAPEQLLGKQPEARSDIYSLGVVAFELLTGRLPHTGSDAMALALAVVTQRAPTPADINPNIPVELSELVARAMAVEPDVRVQSAGEFHVALERVAAHLGKPGTSSATESAATDSRPTRRRRAQRTAAILAGPFIAAIILVLIGIRGWLLPPPANGPPSESAPVIAVLPLANLSGDPSNDFLGVGVAETLMSSLARVPGVTVVSGLTARDEKQDLTALAREVGASFLVDGGVQTEGDRLKVTARLVRPDGSVEWGDEYDASLAEFLPLQARLASGLVGALQLRLTTTERQRVLTPPTSNVDAFAEYAQGRAFLERPDVAGNVERAIQLFASALQRDPKFALAHAGLGEAYWSRYEQTKEPAWITRARDATLDALRLDPDHAAVRSSLAIIYRGTGETEKALDELQRAIALQPNSDAAHRLMGEILAGDGKIDEAVVEFRSAIALRASFWGNYDALGLACFRAGRLVDAAAAFQRVTELQPDSAQGFQRLGTAYHAAGDLVRALENYEKANRLAPTPKAYANIGSLLYAQKKFSESAAAYEQAIKLDPNTPVTYRNLGDVYQRLERGDQARTAYAKAVEVTERMLQINPRDARSLSTLAVCEAKLGRRAKAERDATEAVALSPKDPEILYNRAVVHALGGDSRRAVAALDVALAQGYSGAMAREDDDLVSIRGLPEFTSLFDRKR